MSAGVSNSTLTTKCYKNSDQKQKTKLEVDP